MARGRIFPAGTAQDTAYACSATPATLREKYTDVRELILKAWIYDEVFAFDGKYTHLRFVNVWPRPIQELHQPGRTCAWKSFRTPRTR